MRFVLECEARVIRFNCPNCGRPYELPDALAGLPLVCKQCAQRITPPEPSPEPPPVAVPRSAPASAEKPPLKAAGVPKPPPPAPVKPPPVPAKSSVPQPDEPEDDDVLVSKPDDSPDIDFNIGGPTAASLSEAARTRPSGLSDSTRRPPDLSGAIGPGGDSVPGLNLDLLGPPVPAPPPEPSVPPPPPEAPPAPEERPEATMLPFLADLGAFALLVVAGLLLGEFLAQKPMGQVISEAGAAAKFPPVDLLLLIGPPAVFGLVYLLLGSRERTLGAWLRRRRRSAE
ncbi:MAG: hypothetical protein J0I06_25490 [Planctomycetes bacterium]|nr:hypothetical protein [Planctomycetota bacterium]